MADDLLGSIFGPQANDPLHELFGPDAAARQAEWMKNPLGEDTVTRDLKGATPEGARHLQVEERSRETVDKARTARAAQESDLQGDEVSAADPFAGTAEAKQAALAPPPNPVGDLTQGFGTGWDATLAMMRQNRADFGITVHGPTKELLDASAKAKAEADHINAQQPDGEIAQVGYNIGNLAASMFSSGKQGVKAAEAGAVAGAIGGAAAGAPAGIVGAIPGAITGAVGGGALGLTAGFISDSYVTNAGQIMGDLRESGVDPAVAKKFGMAGGAIMAGLDLFGIGFAARPFVKAVERKAIQKIIVEELKQNALKDAAKDYLIGVAGETGAETTQQIVQDVTTDLAKQSQSPDFKTIFNDPQRRQQVIRNAVQTAVATAEGMAVLGAPGAALTGVREHHQNLDMERGAELLTPEDHDSPLPTDLIAQGKGAFENALHEAQAKPLDQIAGPHPGRIASEPAISARQPQIPAINEAGGTSGPIMGRDALKAHMRQIETGGNDQAHSATSSASGRYQFTDSTWEALGGDPAKKLDPAEQERMMDKLLDQNERALAKAGVQTTAGNLYLAHFLGANGAVHALENPNAQVDAKVQEANAFAKGWTNGQLSAWADRKMGSAASVGTPSTADEGDGDSHFELTFPTIEHKSDELLKEPATLAGDDLVTYAAKHDPGVWNDESLGEEKENYQQLAEHKATLRTVQLKDLKIEPDDEDKLHHYRTLDTKGPPIVVHGDKIIDGNHRAAIAQERGETSIRAYVVDEPQSSLKSTEAQPAPEHIAFAPETGTLGIPRAEMPQIKAEHRGAMVNFLNARGIEHEEETVPASSLKPTQAEYIPAKVEQALNFEGGDRAILVSEDNHIVDGQHQALAAEQQGEDVRIIRLKAPIRKVLAEALNFPSSTLEEGGAANQQLVSGQLAANKPFDPIPHLKPFRQLVRGTNVNLNNPRVVAAKLGIGEADVPRVMAAALASREPAGFFQTKGRPAKGRRKAVPPRFQREQRRNRPLHAMEFIRSIGGVRSDNHDLRNLGNLARHPGVINNKTGMSVDDLGEKLHEAGFIPRERPTEAEVLNFIADASSTRRYATGDETTAQHFAEQDRSEQHAAQEEDARAEIDAALEDADIDFTAAEKDDALRYMADGESAGTAIQMAAHDAAGRTLETGAEETGNDFYAELGKTIYEGEHAEPRGEGTAEALAGREGEPRDAQERDQGGTQPQKSRQAQASVESTAPEHATVGVDDRELSEIVVDFKETLASQGTGDEQITHIFDPPAKGEIVRLNERSRVYNSRHGWMTPEEAKAKIAEWKQHAVDQGENPADRSDNGGKVVLSFFDLSGAWSEPWERAGYEVWRFDIQADKEMGDVNHFSTDFFNDWFGSFGGKDVYAILAATPCTDFASSGARHFAAKDKDGRTVASVKLVQQTLRAIEFFKPAVWALENPVGRIERLGGLPPWRLSFDPNDIGETYTKKTLLWGRFNAELPIAPVDPVEGSKMHKQYGGKSLATKNARSVTPEGFAYSFFMANNAVDHPAMAIANKYDRLDRGLIEKAVKEGVSEEQINDAVEDHYYQDLDDAAANDAIKALLPSSKPAFETPADPVARAKEIAAQQVVGKPAMGPGFSWQDRSNLRNSVPKGGMVLDLTTAEGAREFIFDKHGKLIAGPLGIAGNVLAPRPTDTRDHLQRKADERLIPAKEQKPVGSDGGLFDVQDTTGDMFAPKSLEDRLRGILDVLETPHGRYGVASVQWEKEIQPRNDILYELSPDKPLDASRTKEDEYRSYLGPDRAKAIEGAARDLALGKIERAKALATITDADLKTVQDGETATREEYAYDRTKELADQGNEQARAALATLDALRADKQTPEQRGLEPLFELRTALLEELKGYGIADRIALNVVNALDNAKFQGQFWDRVISVAANKAKDPSHVLAHETIHAMKALGLFTRDEWSHFTAKGWRDDGVRAWVERNYPGKDEAYQKEEAAAEWFANYHDLKKSDDFATRAGIRIAAFIRALKKALARVLGKDWMNAVDLAEQIHKGRIGARETGFGDRVERPVTVRFGTKEPKQSATDAFFQWFKDSKVVDKNGAPLVVYHGTGTDFNVFDTSRQMGAHFGASGQAVDREKFVAAPRQVAAYLSIANPLRMSDLGGFNAAEVAAQLEAKKWIGRKERDRFDVIATEGTASEKDAAIAELKKIIKARGYDGIVYLNRREGLPFGGDAISSEERDEMSDAEFKAAMPEATDSWIAFEPTQIKSTDNRGTFDPTNPDIRASVAGPMGVVDNKPERLVAPLRALLGAETSTAVGEAVDNLRTVIQDRMLPVMRVQAAVERMLGRKLADEENPYLAEEVFHGRTGARLDALVENHVEPLFEDMRARKISPDELETYLYARHAKERNARIASINPEFKPGEGSGMTDEEADAIMAAVDKSGKLDDLKALAEKVDAMLAFSPSTRIESGLLSPEEAATWKATYQHYVPLRGRAGDNEEAARISRQSGMSVRGKESRRAFGRKSKASDILAYSIMQAEEAIVRSEQNEVAKSFLELAKAAPDPSFWRVDKISRVPVLNKASGQVSYRSESRIAAEDAPYTVSAKVAGVEHRVTMNRDDETAVKVASAMRNLNIQQFNFVVATLGSINRFLSKINTTYSPEFVISNAFRDLQTAGINLAGVDVKGIEGRVLKDYPVALKASLKGAFGKESGEWGKWYREFRMEGGQTAFNSTPDLAQLRAKVAKSAKAQGRMGVKQLLGSVVHAIEGVNDGVENALRLSTYKNAVELGVSKKQAASLAKNVTVNFNRKGTAGPLINSMYLFFNASMQGNMRILQAMKSRKVQAILLGTITAGFWLQLLNSAWSDDDDDGEKFYNKISEYEKQRNLIVMMERGHYIKIPMPWGYNVFPNFGRMLARMWQGDKPMKAAGDWAMGVLDAFNPIGGAQSILDVLSPTITDPIVDLMQNRDYAGRPIMPDEKDFGPQPPDAQRYWNSVPAYDKAVTDFLTKATGGDDVRPGAIDMSPESLDFLQQTVLGSAGNFVRNLGALAGKVVDPEKDFDRNDIPMVRKVVGDKPLWYDKAAFYARLAQVEQDVDYAKKYIKSGNREGLDKLIGDERDVLELEKIAKQARKEMRGNRKVGRQLDEAVAKGEVSKDEAKRIRARLDAEQKATIDAFNAIYLQRIKQPLRP